MLHLEHIMPRKKHITTIAIAGTTAAIKTLAAIAMFAYPASYSAVQNAFSTALDRVSQTFAALSERIGDAIASAQNLLGQQVM